MLTIQALNQTTQASFPRCLQENGPYHSVLKTLHTVLHVLDPYGLLTFLLNGSGHRKDVPPDADMIVLSPENSSITIQYVNYWKTHFNSLAQMTQTIKQFGQEFSPFNLPFIEYHCPEYFSFCQNLAPNGVTGILAYLCCNGAVIDAAYEKEHRSIIKIRWGMTVLEWNLQYSSMEAHAAKSDFSINTLYFNIREWRYQTESINFEQSIEDINRKILRPVRDPIEMLENDITTFFRALRIIILEGYTPTAQLNEAINNLFIRSPNALLNSKHHQRVSKKEELFCSGHAVVYTHFLHRHNLLGHLFPNHTTDPHSLEKSILFFQKMAEASDAYYNNVTSSPSYPYKFSKHIKQNLLTIDNSKKLMLCLFDYAIYNTDADKKTPSSDYYPINHVTENTAYNNPANHIAMIHTLWEDVIQSLRPVISKAKVECQLQNLLPTDKYHDSNSEDATTSEEESSEKDPAELSDGSSTLKNETAITNPTDLTCDPQTKTTPVSEKNQNTQEDSGKISGQSDTENNEIILSKNKKKKKKSKNKNHSLTQEEQEIYNIYSNGIDLLRNNEHEKALNYLKQSAETEVCKEEVKINAEKLLAIINPEDKTFSPKQFLSVAVLFDSAGENSEAAKYYQKFFVEQARKNINLDKSEPEESLRTFSFIYFRLMLIFLELSQDSEKSEFYKMISDKYRNEIILSQVIDEKIKNQERSHAVEPSLKKPSQKKSKNSANKTAILTERPGHELWLEEANRNLDRGLYYNAKLCYYEALTGLDATELVLFLIKQIMICYVQLEMYEESICFLEKQKCKFDFSKDLGGAQVIERILIAISHKSCQPSNLNEFFASINLIERIMHITGSGDDAVQFFKANLECLSEAGAHNFLPDVIRQKKSFFYFKIAAICSKMLLEFIKKDRTITEKVSLLFQDMTHHYEIYKQTQGTRGISAYEEKTISIRISSIRFALNLPEKIVTPASFFQPTESSLATGNQFSVMITRHSSGTQPN